jgi:hypothetical protein
MKRLGITLLIISLFVFVGMAYAVEQKAEMGKAEKPAMGEKQMLATAAKVSMAAALATASKQVAGTVIAAELENEDGKTIYCFEILPTADSAIVKEVKIDAVTGTFIGTEDENAEKEASEKTAESKEWAGKKGKHGEECSCKECKEKEAKEKDNEKE